MLTQLCCTRTGYVLLEHLFGVGPVFFGLFRLGILGLIKVSFSSRNIALVNKLVFPRRAFECDHPESKKKLVF